MSPEKKWFLAQNPVRVFEVRPYEEGEDLEAQGVAVNEWETPQVGGFVIRSPQRPQIQWYCPLECYGLERVGGRGKA